MAEDLHIQLMLTEPRIAAITESKVGQALATLRISAKRSSAWITRAVQGALYTSLVPASMGHDRPSNSDLRDEIAKAAKIAAKLQDALAELSWGADQALYDYAFSHWLDDDQKPIVNALQGVPTLYRDYQEATRRLGSLRDFLQATANELDRKKQPAGWRRAQLREERIWRAQCLSPIYATAFDREPTVITFPGSEGLGPWAEFYQAMVSIAFGEHATPNIEEVLDEARRRDKVDRVVFSSRTIPD